MKFNAKYMVFLPLVLAITIFLWAVPVSSVPRESCASPTTCSGNVLTQSSISPMCCGRISGNQSSGRRFVRTRKGIADMEK